MPDRGRFVAGVRSRSLRRAPVRGQHVVHTTRIARAHLHGLDPPVLAEASGHLEALHVDETALGNRDLLGQFEYGIRSPDAPVAFVGRRRRQVGRVALRRTGIHPRQYRHQLVVVQPPLVRQRPVPFLGERRRHRPRRDASADRSRPGSDVLEAEKGHRRDLAGTMAGGAVVVEDGRDVSREGRNRRLCGDLDGYRQERSRQRGGHGQRREHRRQHLVHDAPIV